ncbi:MAG: glycoside hydrolase family 44 protein [Bryobacteraceae bacterium]
MPAQVRIHPVITALVLCACGFAQNPATSVSIDANINRHAINPHIYGFSFAATSDLAATNFTMNRYGGNATTRYNWQINATNHASDWYFESILDTPATPGYDGDAFITTTRAASVGAQPLLTIPMLNYIAKLGPDGATLWSFSVAKYGPQTGTDPWNPDAGNGVSTAAGNPYITGNDPSDANTPNSVAIQQAWVQHLIDTWGTAASGGLQYYIMDNEYSIWDSTHRDVHPVGANYEEIYNDFVNYAGAVRALDPNALIAGFEEWGWWAQYLSGYDQQNGIAAGGSDYNTHSQTYYYPWLLQQLYQYQQSTGTQLLDVLTVHYYPQDASGSGDDSTATQLIRNQSTRSLWDPNYVDQSWINEVGINGGKVYLIPTLKSWVSQYYPGLQVGITEYNWGDEANLNGATTQADALGIFGREGLDLSTRWTVPVNPSPTYLAMEIYRNYDGNLSTFGDTSVSAAVANPDYLSSFAAVRSSDGALTVMVINKQQGSTPVTVSLANFGTTGTAQAFQISSASQTQIAHLADVSVANNAIATTVPSQSITLFVIPAGSITSLPTAPGGLAATVGSGTVTLTWNAGGGATSYSVQRGTVSGGPYTAIGTVTDPSPTSFTDKGLTNGKTYYYVVAGTNAKGTGPNSAELAATPIVPPTFSSSASALPNPVIQGSMTAISATVTCTANTLQNGIVQILVLDPNGNTAVTQNFTAQSFTASQSHGYSLDLTPALAGYYTVEVGVFSSTWQLWNWNSSAASIAVNSSTTFTSSATPSAYTINPGGTSSIAVTVTETGSSGLTNAIVELQIFNQSGTAVATTYWSGQNFAAGQKLKYAYTWSPGSSIPLGPYSVDLGVFDGGWTHDYYWNTDATITVTSALLPTIKSLSPSSATAGGAAFTLTINGTNFASGATATWGSTALKTTFVSSSKLTAAVPARLIETAGTANVTVTTAGGTSAAATFTVSVAQPPALVSLTPAFGTGQSVVFSAVYSDPNGVTDLDKVLLLVNASVSEMSACYVGYYPQGKQLYLRNDAGTAWLTPALTPGGSGTLANSQCTLNASTSTVSEAGNNLTLNASVTFTGAVVGSRNVYLYAAGLSGLNTGWVEKGTWTATSAGPPAIVSLTPGSGTGLPAVFSAVYSDPNGAADLNKVLLLVNTSVNEASACYVYYYPQGNQLYLRNDAGTAWLMPALTPGGGGTLANSQCTLNASTSAVSVSGNTLTLKASVTFTSVVVGPRNVYLYASGLSGQNSGWVEKGTWTAATSAGPPVIVSLTPGSGTGQPAALSAVYSDPNGAADLNEVLLLVNTSLNGSGACYVYYSPQGNQLYLRNDAGTAWLAPALTPGGSGTLANSQCTLNASSTTVSVAGNSLTLNISVTFAGAVVGSHNVYLYASGLSGQNSGWVKEGTWTP